MRDRILWWCKIVGYALVLILAVLCVIAAASMPQWYLITMIILAGVATIDYMIIRKLK